MVYLHLCCVKHLTNKDKNQYNFDSIDKCERERQRIWETLKREMINVIC